MTDPQAINQVARLVLGTVQLGMTYGVANVSGQPTTEQATEMLEAAWNGGIRRFDTAQAYGDSERVLGAALKTLGYSQEARITTKVQWNSGDTKGFADVLSASCQRLGVPALECVLFHDESCLADESRAEWEAAIALLAQDERVGSVGISVYTLEGALQAMACPTVTAIQIPGNVLDRRFADDVFLTRVRQRGIRLQVRSVFLQGLLLMPHESVPPALCDAADVLAALALEAQALGLSRAALALGFVAQKWPNAEILVGAETKTQVCENLDAWAAGLANSQLLALEGHEAFEAIPEAMIRPDLWGNT